MTADTWLIVVDCPGVNSSCTGGDLNPCFRKDLDDPNGVWLLSSGNVFIASVSAYIKPNSVYCLQSIPEAATRSIMRCCRPDFPKVFGVLVRSRWTVNSERIKGNWEPNLVNEIGHSSPGSSPPPPPRPHELPDR